MSKLEGYIEAYRAYSALARAIGEDGETPERREALALARLETRRCYGRLNGGEIAKARRALEALERGRRPPHPLECRHALACAGLGSCPDDPTCID